MLLRKCFIASSSICFLRICLSDRFCRISCQRFHWSSYTILTNRVQLRTEFNTWSSIKKTPTAHILQNLFILNYEFKNKYRSQNRYTVQMHSPYTAVAYQLYFSYALFNNFINCWCWWQMNKWVWSILRMKMTQENWRNCRKTCPSALLCPPQTYIH